LTKASVKVGRAIDVGEVVSRSAKMLSARPHIMLPQVILLVTSLATDVLSSSNPLRTLVSILSVVLSLMASGAYPSMVKTVIDGGQPSVTEALGKAFHRFWALLAAAILVALIVLLGSIAFLVPGIIFATWYAYTIPAIMLEDKGALAGMSASKAFGRDKKWATFLIFLIVIVTALAVFAIDDALSLASHPLGQVVYAILSVPLGAWISVILSYTYLTYGPSSVPATPATTDSVGYGIAPSSPASPQPAAQPVASADTQGSFCRFCGSRVPPGSKFCASCGKPV
jgi:hypothetical protein